MHEFLESSLVNECINVDQIVDLFDMDRGRAGFGLDCIVSRPKQSVSERGGGTTLAIFEGLLDDRTDWERIGAEAENRAKERKKIRAFKSIQASAIQTHATPTPPVGTVGPCLY